MFLCVRLVLQHILRELSTTIREVTKEIVWNSVGRQASPCCHSYEWATCVLSGVMDTSGLLPDNSINAYPPPCSHMDLPC